MSYSFSVTAVSKIEAAAKVSEELDKIVTNQSVHAVDRQAVQNAAEAFISMLADPSENEAIAVSVSGYLSWRDEGVFTTGNVSITAHISSALPA